MFFLFALHGRSAKLLLPPGLTWPDLRQSTCSPGTEIRGVVLEQMSSVSLAPCLFVALTLKAVSTPLSDGWVTTTHCAAKIKAVSELCVIKCTQTPDKTLPSSLLLTEDLCSPSCRQMLMWLCLKPSSVTPVWKLVGLSWVLYSNSLVLPLFCFEWLRWGQWLAKISQTGSGDRAGLGMVPHWASNPSTPTASPLYFNGRRMISQHFKESKKAVESFLDSSLK